METGLALRSVRWSVRRVQRRRAARQVERWQRRAAGKAAPVQMSGGLRSSWEFEVRSSELGCGGECDVSFFKDDYFCLRVVIVVRRNRRLFEPIDGIGPRLLQHFKDRHVALVITLHRAAGDEIGQFGARL